MKIGKLILAACLIAFLIFASEFTNYVSNPTSPSSAAINRYFLDKSILEAKNGRLESAIKYLSIASRINIFGEYGHYRRLLPADYKNQPRFPDNGKMQTELLTYLSGLTSDDLTNAEDQGLAWIHYRMGLIAYKNNEPNLAESMFKTAIYNFPEFPSFHVELANFYFERGDVSNLAKSLEYCSRFEGSSGFCQQFKEGPLKAGTPQPVGFMELPINEHYFKQ